MGLIKPNKGGFISNERTIMKETHVTGFDLDPDFGYAYMDTAPTFTLKVGETYRILWDGASFTCTAEEITMPGFGSFACVGNLTNFGLSGNNEPFAIASSVNTVLYTAFDYPNAWHDIGIFQKVSGGGNPFEGMDVHYLSFRDYTGEVELFNRPIFDGDNAYNPVSKNKMERPTKPADAVYSYSFTGWSKANDNTVDSDALTSVTEDRSLYPVFTGTKLKYKITFILDENNIVGKQYEYGVTPDYIPSKDGMYLGGWQPPLAPVTGDATYSAIWVTKVDFATGTWADIATVCESGSAEQHFTLGETRPFTFTAPDGNSYNVNLVINGFYHDTLADGSGKAGISVTTDIATFYARKGDGTQADCEWNACELRTKLNGELFNSFPVELRNVIKSVQKKYGYYNSSSSSGAIGTVNDKVWIPSVGELGATANSTWSYVVGDGDKFAYYVKDKKDPSGEAAAYKLRTGITKSNSSSTAYYRPGFGVNATTPQSQSRTVFGFCI